MQFYRIALMPALGVGAKNKKAGSYLILSAGVGRSEI